jgi:hypothetical protein
MTISVKDAIWRENSGRYRRALKLKHSIGSYVIIGNREEIPARRYLPQESENGRQRKEELARWWMEIGSYQSFRNISRPLEVCSLSDFVRKPVQFGEIYETIIGTVEYSPAIGLTIADESDQVVVRFRGDVVPTEDLDAFEFQQFKVECSRSTGMPRNEIMVEGVEQVSFGEAARYYATLLDRL